MVRRFGWALAAPLVLALVLLAAAVPAPAAAQSQAVAPCPVPEALNGVEVCVDRGDGAVYFEGDPITICVTVNIPQIAIYPPPPPPLVRVTNSVNGGPPRVLFEERMASGQRCIHGVISPPFGVEVIRAEVIGQDGRLIASDTATYVSAPRSTQPGPATLTVDRGPGGVYTIGELIQICYDVPGPGPVTITNIHADGTRHVLLSGFEDGTGACFTGTVTGPAGTECLRLSYSTTGGSGSVQTCFQVVGAAPPPATAFISTDKSVYQIGELIRICYDVPGPGPVTITDIQPNGSHVLLSGYEDGTGACFLATVTPPPGIECLRLDFSSAAGSGSRQTCFQVRA